jgi:hypothetical protein
MPFQIVVAVQAVLVPHAGHFDQLVDDVTTVVDPNITDRRFAIRLVELLRLKRLLPRATKQLQRRPVRDANPVPQPRR